MRIEEIGNDVRDAINLLVVFEEEYDLPAEVVSQLRAKLEKIAQDITKL